MKRYLVKVALEHFAFGLTLSVSVIWMLAQGLALTEIALITSLALAIGLIIDIPTGFVSDKFGRKLTLVSASFFVAAAFLLFAFSHDFWQFLLAAALQAIGFALVSGSEEAFIYEIKPQNYRKTLSEVNVVDEAATIVGLLIAPVLIAQFSLRSVFVVASVIVFVTATTGWIFLKDSVASHNPKARRPHQQKIQVLSLIRRHALLLLVFSLLAIYYEGGRVFWQPQLVASGFHPEQLGFLFAAFKVASLIGAYIGRHERFSPKREIVAIELLITISFLLIATSLPYFVIAGFFLYSFLENTYRIIESNYLQRVAGDNRRASFLSAANFMRQGYSIIALPLLSIAAVANITSVFYLLALLQVIAALTFWWVADRFVQKGR